MKSNVVEDLQQHQTNRSNPVRRPTADVALRKKVPHAEVPSSAPKQQIAPHENREEDVFKRDLRPSMSVEKSGKPRRRTLKTNEEERDEETAEQRHDVRLVVGMVPDVWKDECIGYIPDATPDTDAGRNDDELREEAVKHERNQAIMLRQQRQNNNQTIYCNAKNTTG